MHATEPIQSGQLKVAGFGIGYETFGDPARPVVRMLPVVSTVHSRLWKMQVPYLARFFHVIAYDPPGNGGGERTLDPAAYEYDRIVDQGAGLLEHLGVAQAAVVGISRGCWFALDLAARYPERVARAVLISNLYDPAEAWAPSPANFERLERYEGLQKWNYHDCREHYPEFLHENAALSFSEPHSSKAIDDFIVWGLETTPEMAALSGFDLERFPKRPVSDVVARVHCPVLILQGGDDLWASVEVGRALAAGRPTFELVILEGCSHIPTARDPVRVNLLMAEFPGIR